MKKLILILGAIPILLVVSLSGCTNEGNNDDTDVTDDIAKFVGTWRYES